MTDPHAAALAAVVALEADAASMLAAAGFPPDLTRPPTPAEVASRTDFAAMEAADDDHAARIAARARQLRTRMLDLLGGILARTGDVALILAALDSLAASGRVVPDVEQLVADTAVDLADLLDDLAVGAIARTAADLVRAGIPTPYAGVPLAQLQVPPAVAPVVVEHARRVAVDAVDSSVRSIRGAAWSTPRTGVAADVFLSAVMATAHAASTKALDDVATQAALAVSGASRVQTLTDPMTSSRATFYASELLDRRTCAPCSHVDGREYASAAEMLADYPAGRYVACLGGYRCRGTAVAVSASERPATLPRPADRPARRRVDGTLIDV